MNVAGKSIEVASQDTATYADFTAVIDLLHEVGYTQWMVVAPERSILVRTSAPTALPTPRPPNSLASSIGTGPLRLVAAPGAKRHTGQQINLRR